MERRPASAVIGVLVGVVGALSTFAWVTAAQRGGGGGRGGAAALAEPFVGVTTTGTVQPNLFPIRATGVSTGPVRDAATRFLASLTADQRGRTAFAADDLEWRDWNNVHRYARKGVNFKELSDAQREHGFDLLRASLSARGFEKARNVMRLNGYVADVLKNPEEYGEFLYHLTVMGVPSDREPWGWQLDGHHLIINYFVLGDQVVMTPTFMGSEPVSASTGQYAGTRVLTEEQDLGLALATSLTPEQRKVAVIQTAKTANHSLAQAFRDNLVLDYAGIRADALTPAQRQQLMAVIGEYVRNMRDGHATLRLSEIEARLNDTYFAWIGDIAPDAVFYYRIHSPVVLIEFDHQTPVALPGARVPQRNHVHTVVRTPNGNDYGKDLLRQHYQQHANDPAHGHK
jgi:Protein of unknown function (DUF3500)